MGPVETTGSQAPKGDRDPDDTTGPSAGLVDSTEGDTAAPQEAVTDTSAEDLGLTLVRAPGPAIPGGGGSGPLTALLNHLTILGPPEKAFPPTFLLPHGAAATPQAQAASFAPRGDHPALVAMGEKGFDLAAALRGAPLLQDLTNIGKMLTGVPPDRDPHGAGGGLPAHTGAAGPADQPAHGHGAGKIDVGEIVKPKDWLPPSGS